MQLEQTLIKTVCFFFLIICWSLESKHTFRVWMNDNSWRVIFADFSKTAEKNEKTRHHFKGSFNINILNWKVNRKINSVRTWSSRKAEYLNKITLFLPLKFDYANYLFPIPSISFLCFWKVLLLIFLLK